MEWRLSRDYDLPHHTHMAHWKKPLSVLDLIQIDLMNTHAMLKQQAALVN